MLSVAQDASVTRENSVPALRYVQTQRTVFSNFVARSSDEIAEAAGYAAAAIKALTDPLTEEEAYSGPYAFDPEPEYIYEGDSYKEAMLALEGDLSRCVFALSPAEYTDGSPVQLPLRELVDEMMAATSHKRDEVIGPLGPNMTDATVWSVAVNGVMAGCKPETMPLLLALTEAMVNTNITEALMGAQGGFSFGAIVNGPYAEEIKMNAGGPNLAGPAPLTPGVPANTSVGRFIRLMMVNIGGVEPGIYEAKGIGNPHKTSIVMAEADTESPWPQFSTDIGFADKENTVSLFVFWVDMLNGFRARYTGPEGEPTIQNILGPATEAAKFLSRSQQGLVVFISPAQAQELADAGYTREDCKQWISDHCVDTYEKAMLMGLGSGQMNTVYSVQGDPVNPTGAWPAEWRDPNFDPQTIVKYFPNPKGIQIIVGIGSWNGLIMNGTPRWTVAIDKWK